MLFECEADALAWYQGQERVLTKKFLDAIPWDDVGKHAIDPAFFPVLVYMRDIEKSTEIYFEELRRTPTWKDRHVRSFMERWVSEEPLHGDLLDRFLGEAGYPTNDKWFDELKARIPRRERVMADLQALVAHCFGRRFSAVHMTIGAVNELTTLTGYQRLWTLAKHPVLEQLLRGIAREEARHYFFYWSVGRVQLLRSDFARHLNRFIVSKYWVPVGQGIKTADETNHVLTTLFGAEDGLAIVDRQINQVMERLPGMKGLKTVTNRFANSITASS